MLVKVWDNFGVGNSNKLDQLQLDAARICTGLPIFVSSIRVRLGIIDKKKKRRKWK
jgi:hypothetical protein